MTKRRRHKIIYFLIRARYEAKRRTQNWRRRKKKGIIKRHDKITSTQRQEKKPYIEHIAPERFSFIHNTNVVLKYFIEAEKLFRRKEKINFNINDIQELTPDAIALLVASVNDKDFHHNSGYIGGAPVKPELKKLFEESGFYKFVGTSGFHEVGDGNLLHKEKHTKVMPLLAKNAALAGIRHTFGNENPYEPLYNILIECMSNTNNHATNPKNAEKCKWWLYVYNEPDTKNTSYSFLDLGVGIFDSIIVKNYITKAVKKLGLYKNINFVDDLLSGQIQSRIEEDREIRGKGIPQIVEYSKRSTFKEFYIITNDVKIDIKTSKKEQLDDSFRGTFIYWKIQKTK